MSLAQEYIPELEIVIGEGAVLAWTTTDLQAQFSYTISSVAWSSSVASVMTVGTGSNDGDTYSVPVTAVAAGCAYLVAAITSSDVNQNPTKLLMKIYVIDPTCPGI